MQTVHPIRDEKSIELIKSILFRQSFRDYLLFIFGIHTGLRISDLLSLKWKDILDEDMKIKHRIELKEQKTAKIKSFSISNSTKRYLKDFFKTNSIKLDEYIFKSWKGDNAPITRQQAYRILSAAAIKAGVKEKIGTHTPRKAFGYHLYKKGIDLSRIQKMLNHSSQGVTLDYIGITQEEIDNIYLELDI